MYIEELINTGLKEKEALNLKIELLMKQVEFHKKESELKDKALEDERLINELKAKEAQDASIINRIKAKQLDDLIVIQELKGKLLDLKALYGHDVSFSQEFSAIQFRAENSIANNDFVDMQEVTGYIGRLLEAERENSGTGDFSTLLANISPIPHPVAVNNAGNFDIDNQPIYRSIYIEDRSCQPGQSLVERQMESLDLSSINLSPINHGEQNQILGNIIGNFDNQHITTSVVLGGEGSDSFSIIQDDGSH